ncbi:MAG TPA: DNA translocase FtsK 4TM domain-containing protein [Actinomycetota bacterium]|nr:DNA translocase FtsK 4TM domain-containing protein [Actinomycetota bacterium]
MATKTSPSRRSSSRVFSRPAGKKTSAKRPSGRKPAPKKKPQRAPATQILSPFARDTLGIGLMVLAGLAVLSVWFDAAGPMGDAFSRLLHTGFGLAAVLFPLVGLGWGIALLRDRSPEERMRMLIGFVIMGLGVLGLVSIVRGNPGVFAPAVDTKVRGAGVTQGFSDAAGFFGTLGASPLSKVMSPAGAALVDLGLAVIGTLIMTGTSFAELGRKVARARASLAERYEAKRADEQAKAEAKLEKQRLKDERAMEKAEKGSKAKLTERLGLTEPVVVLPESEALGTLDLPPDAADEASGSTSAPTKARGRTITTADGPYRLPPLDLLRTAPPSTNDGVHEKDIMEALGHTLSTFGVDARVTAAHRGPTVTMYEVAVASGTKVNKVLNLSSDIAYALATPDVRIIAPIPGKSAIGIEVPNRHRDFVMLGDILRSRAAKQATHPLQVALGKDIHGEAQMVNLATMPHVLIAGATGAGKSSLVNSFVTSILMRTSPDDVRLVLIDPKRVELSHFAEVPHLLSPVIVHPKRATEALEWIVREMEMRYEMLATVGVRDIDGYEEGLREGTLRLPVGREHDYRHMSYIVVVIDELADLMMVAPRAVEDAICRIAQMARAVGIHLVVATQRPSVDVVTGLIKANIPSRIALMTSSQADSRVVLDQNGAEKLVGHGDMLFAPANASKPTRLQGAWVTEAEIQGISEFIRAQREVVYEQHVEGLGIPPTEAELSAGTSGAGDSDDDLLSQAAELIIRSQLGSTSMLQRKLKVGFARAGRIMDLLEEQGIVGPSQGSKARDVLVTWDEWEERRGA